MRNGMQQEFPYQQSCRKHDRSRVKKECQARLAAPALHREAKQAPEQQRIKSQIDRIGPRKRGLDPKAYLVIEPNRIPGEVSEKSERDYFPGAARPFVEFLVS